MLNFRMKGLVKAKFLGGGCSLLLILGVIVVFAPMGRSTESESSCGPRAIAALLQEKAGMSTEVDKASKRVESEFSCWDYIPKRMSLIGGATLPWGISHAMEREGLTGKMRVGIAELCPGQAPFIALILDSGKNWHYVAVLEVRDKEILTNDGLKSIDEFLEKWRWSWYWGYELEREITAPEPAQEPNDAQQRSKRQG